MEQSGFVRGQHQQHIGGIDPQFDKAGGVQPSNPFLHRFGAQPQEGTPFPRAQAEEGGNPSPAAGIFLIGEDFMQAPTRQSTTYCRVHPVMPQRE